MYGFSMELKLPFTQIQKPVIYLHKLLATPCIFSRNPLVFAVLLIFNHFLIAQDLSRVAPKIPAVQEQGEIKNSENPKDNTLTQTPKAQVLIEQFRGLVLWKSSLEMQSAGVETVQGLKSELTMNYRKDLEIQLEPFWNKPLTDEGVAKLVQVLESYFLRKESQWVLAQVEEQKIKNGVLQIVIVPGKVGQVRITGNRWFKTEKLQEQFELTPGEPLNQKEMTQTLENFNQNPFRQGDLYMKASDIKGCSDVDLKIQDRFPARFYSGYENNGNNLTGNDRWFAGFNWGDAFWQGHLMSYQFTTDGWFDRFKSHTGSYSVFMPWGGQRFDLVGGYSEATGTVADFNIQGKSWLVGGRYRIPLPKFNEVRQEVSVGYEFKQSNNNLEFGGANVFNHFNDVSQFVAEYQGSLADPWGSTRWSGKVYGSPGGMTENSLNSVYRESRANAKADYLYAQVELERRFTLPWGVSSRHQAQIQWASGNLLGSEQIGAGGRESVRGYSEREANGDEGLLMQNELWSPTGSLGALLKDFGVPEAGHYQDKLQGLLFWDYGVVRNRFLLRGEDREKILSSVGLGARYSINTYMSFRGDYGVQLTDSGQNNPDSYFVHLSMTLSY